MVNAKKKGNAGENNFANWMQDHGFKAYKEASSGGGSREKGDIVNNLDMTIEVKTTKKTALPDWWKQVTYSAAIHKNQPVLVIHLYGMPTKEWMIVMHSEDWIEMLKESLKEKEVTEVPKGENRALKYKIENLIRGAKDVVKLLEV